MKDICVGIIGYGFMGHEHEKMMKKMDGFHLKGVSDTNPERLKNIAEDVIAYKTNEELLDDADIQLVIISANNNQHYNLVCQAARAGKDIICEKPVAMSVQEMDKMMEVVNECGVKFTVHQQRRFDPDFRTIKNAFDKKLLGDVYTIKSSLYGFNGYMHEWHVYAEEGGGMLYDWGVHLLDQILWMMPEAKLKSVFADIRNVINFEVDDYFKILMKFDNNVMAEVELGTYYLTGEKYNSWYNRHWIMAGNNGTAYTDGFSPTGKIVRTSHLLTEVKKDRASETAGPTRSFGAPAEGTILSEPIEIAETKHEEFFENYRNAYWGKEEFLVKTSEVRRVLLLMEAARESARTGKSIDFEQYCE